MLFFLACQPEAQRVVVKGRMESEDGRTVGKVLVAVGPGQALWGYTYEDLMALGTGSHDLRLPAPCSLAPPEAKGA